MPASARTLAVAAAVDVIGHILMALPEVADSGPEHHHTDDQGRQVDPPGLLVVAAGIGAGDIVSSTIAASAHGLRLPWVVALATFLKSVLNERIARWQLASGMTAIEGWTGHLPERGRYALLVYLSRPLLVRSRRVRRPLPSPQPFQSQPGDRLELFAVLVRRHPQKNERHIRERRCVGARPMRVRIALRVNLGPPGLMGLQVDVRSD